MKSLTIGGRRRVRWLEMSVTSGLLLMGASARAASGTTSTGIVFRDIAAKAGITYRRAPSATQALYDAQMLKPLYDLSAALATPVKPHGAPGVALLDFDGDGDLDIYATNGPGRANSLYSSQLAQTGKLTFIDVARQAKVDATDMDSNGVCFGDIDNDGDEDLLVLGRMENNRLFRNLGNGTFSDISAEAKVGGGALFHSSCSMGDINGDGKLDIFVGNAFDTARKEAIVTELFGYNQPNQLFLNLGDGKFSDVSVSSGIRKLGIIPSNEENSTITWAVAMVDYDQDGDVDIIHGDDQGAMPTSGFAGVDRGFIQIFNNDGKGHFTNVAGKSRDPGRMNSIAEQWMGLAFGDLNCDQSMDIFGTSVGDFQDVQLVGASIPTELSSSLWHYGSPDGTFSRASLGDLVTTPFGWGTGMADYDNDGFTDIIFYGGLDGGVIMTADNPGTVLHNEGCTGAFTWDGAATAPSRDRVQKAETQGVALGDLNNDGFVDIVHVASEIGGDKVPLLHDITRRGGPLDAIASYIPIMMPVGPDFEGEWNGVKFDDGPLFVEVNSADNGNRWVQATLEGTVGLTSGGKVNRDGIGGVVYFTPSRGQRVMAPVLGGSSYASEHALSQSFGLGKAKSGTLEVLWPGGIRNRLYDVNAGEHVKLPEIPCSFLARTTKAKYDSCVKKALDELRGASVISASESTRLRSSALRAFDESR